jgi:hypothetical protein
MNLDGLYTRHGETNYPASPADILPRLGFEECEECDGGRYYFEDERRDGFACSSCRGGWIPGDAIVEVMAKALQEAQFSHQWDHANEETRNFWRGMARAGLSALLDHWTNQ